MNEIRGSKTFKDTWYCGSYMVKQTRGLYYVSKNLDNSDCKVFDFWWEVIDYLGEVNA